MKLIELLKCWYAQHRNVHVCTRNKDFDQTVPWGKLMQQPTSEEVGRSILAALLQRKTKARPVYLQLRITYPEEEIRYFVGLKLSYKQIIIHTYIKQYIMPQS